MLKGKIGKRILCCMLAVCMVFTGSFAGNLRDTKAQTSTQKIRLADSKENNYEKLTFSDFGVSDGQILNSADTHKNYGTTAGDLDGILFQGRIKFPKAGTTDTNNFGNIYIGAGNWFGVAITSGNAGNMSVGVISSSTTTFPIEDSVAGVSIRNNDDLKVGISIKYVNENTEAGTTDLEIGVWLNDVLYNNQYFQASNVKTADLVRRIHTYDTKTNNAAANVTVASVYEENPLATAEEAAYEKLTFSDFGVLDGKILNSTTNGVHTNYGIKDGDLDEILFQGYFEFPSLDKVKQFGNIYIGNPNWWAIGLDQSGTGDLRIVVPDATLDLAGVANLSQGATDIALRENKNLEISISVKYLNTNETAGTTDLKIGVWLNGRFATDSYIYARNVKLANLKRCIHTWENDVNSTVTITSVNPVRLENSPEKDYEKLTFSDFGILDGTIMDGAKGDKVAYTTLPGTLDEVLFQGKYIFPEATSKEFGQIFLGKADWYGVGFTETSAGDILLSVISDGSNVTNKAVQNLTVGSTRTELRNNNELEIALSIKYENVNEEAGTTDLKVGVWINGLLHQNDYIYARNVKLSDLTRCIHTWDQDANSSVTIASVGEKQTPETIKLEDSEEVEYERLTFADFGVKDGEILAGEVGEKVSYATLPGTLDKVLFQGKYTFPAKSASKQFGNIYWGRADWWCIGMSQDYAGNILLSVISDGSDVSNPMMQYLTLGDTETGLRDKTSEIAISIKYENVNEEEGITDLKIGVWIDGILHKGDYIYAKNVKLSDLTRCFHTYDMDANSVVKIASVDARPVQTIPTNFTNITLSDAGILDGNTVSFGKFSKLDSLNKTLFSANLCFNKAGARIHLGTPGGSKEAYSGMGIRLDASGTLIFGNELASKEGTQECELTYMGVTYLVIKPELVGMGETFEGQDFLLQVSTEFVDRDGKGGKNDIKVGIFINGNLYCNQYMYVLNQADILGTGVTINGINETDFARFSSVALEELTLSDFGIADGSYADSIYKSIPNETLDQTAVTMQAAFGQNSAGYIGFGAEGKGIRFAPTTDKKLGVFYVSVDGTVTEVAKLNVAVNTAMKFRTTFEFINAGDAKTNLKLGVFVNGKLYNYRYFVIEDVDTAAFVKGIYLAPEGTAITISANTYEELTLRDYIIENQTYTNSTSKIYNYEGADYDGTAFSAMLRFKKGEKNSNNKYIYLGGKKWVGLRMEVSLDDKVIISYIGEDGKQLILARVTPSEVGMKSFYETPFEYRVTFDVLEMKKGQLSYIANVYINGELCQGKPLLVNNVDEVALQRGVFFYIAKNAGSITVQATRPKVDFTIFGYTEKWRETLGIRS